MGRESGKGGRSRAQPMVILRALGRGGQTAFGARSRGRTILCYPTPPSSGRHAVGGLGARPTRCVCVCHCDKGPPVCYQQRRHNSRKKKITVVPLALALSCSCSCFRELAGDSSLFPSPAGAAIHTRAYPAPCTFFTVPGITTRRAKLNTIWSLPLSLKNLWSQKSYCR